AGRDDQLSYLRCSYADAAMNEAEKLSGTAAEEAWLEAVRMYQQEHDADMAIEIAEAALSEHSQSQMRHVELGKVLLGQRAYASAAEHLQWAASRAPEDTALQNLASQAIKLKLQSESRTAEQPRTERFK